MIGGMIENATHSEDVVSSIKKAMVTTWEGKAKADTTSREVLELYAPRRTAAEVLKF